MADRRATSWYTGDSFMNARNQHLRNAISKVQKQKQRPTAARICKAVRQCVDNVTLEQIGDWLNAAVESGDILMINNDGVISYREPRQNAAPLPAATRTAQPAAPDLLCRSDASWFPGRYEQFRDFMVPAGNWSFTQPTFETYMPFADRVAEPYESWNGSFVAGFLEQQRMYATEPVRQHYAPCVSDPTFYEPTEKYARIQCDENLNRRDCSFNVPHVASMMGPVPETQNPIGHVSQQTVTGGNDNRLTSRCSAAVSAQKQVEAPCSNSLITSPPPAVRNNRIDAIGQSYTGLMPSGGSRIARDMANVKVDNYEQSAMEPRPQVSEVKAVVAGPDCMPVDDMSVAFPKTSDAGLSSHFPMSEAPEQKLETVTCHQQAPGDGAILACGESRCMQPEVEPCRKEATSLIDDNSPCSAETSPPQIDRVDDEFVPGCTTDSLSEPNDVVDADAADTEMPSCALDEVVKGSEMCSDDLNSDNSRTPCHQSVDECPTSVESSLNPGSQAYLTSDAGPMSCGSDMDSMQPAAACVSVPSCSSTKRPGRVYSSLHPRGLIDGLSRFFTPSDRRGPRVCRERFPGSLRPTLDQQPRNIGDGPHAIDVKCKDAFSSASSSIHKSVELPVTTSLPSLSPSAAPTDLLPTPSVVGSGSITSFHQQTSTENPQLSSAILCMQQQSSPSVSSVGKRPREQLIDGLSHFFTASGKRRSCASARLCSDLGRNTDSDATESGTGSVKNRLSGDESSCSRLMPSLEKHSRAKLASSRYTATVKLKRLSASLNRGQLRQNAAAHRSSDGAVYHKIDERQLSANDSVDSHHLTSELAQEAQYEQVSVQPPVIMHHDLILFKKSQKIAIERRLVSRTCDMNPLRPCLRMIQFGQYEMQTSFTSHYQPEFSSLSKLFICEFCLKCMKNEQLLQRHTANCAVRHPPGNEIYHGEDGLSVYEVDGSSEDASAAVYCSNLCLLAELFVSHDLMPACAAAPLTSLRFYVLLRKGQEDNCALIGCLLKEGGVRSSSDLHMDCDVRFSNRSCLFVLPPYQNTGYGTFLINFGYNLCRLDGSCTTPCVGAQSSCDGSVFRSYWLRKVLECLEQLHVSQDSVTVKDIAKMTGICPHDVTNTLRLHGLANVDGITNTSVLSVKCDVVTALWQQQQSVCQRFITLDVERVHLPPPPTTALSSTQDGDVASGRVHFRSHLQNGPRYITGMEASLGVGRSPVVMSQSRRRPPKRKTMRNSTALKLKKMRLTAKQLCVNTDGMSEQSVVGTIDDCKPIPSAGDVTPAVDCDRTQPEQAADEGNGDTTDMKAESALVDLKTEESSGFAEDESCSAVKLEMVDNENDVKSDQCAILPSNPAPTLKPNQVSVAVQTDAYDSDEDDDDDDSNDSSSTCSSCDDESSDSDGNTDESVSSPPSIEQIVDQESEPAQIEAAVREYDDVDAGDQLKGVTINEVAAENELPPQLSIALDTIADTTSVKEDVDLEELGCDENDNKNTRVSNDYASAASPVTDLPLTEPDACSSPCVSNPVVETSRPVFPVDTHQSLPPGIDSPNSINGDGMTYAEQSLLRQPNSYVETSQTMASSHVNVKYMSPHSRTGNHLETTVDKPKNMPSGNITQSRTRVAGNFECSGDNEYITSEPAIPDGLTSFKVPAQSPDDTRYSTEPYHGGVGYNSSPYGISSSESSPVCSQLMHAGGQNSLLGSGGNIGYSLPTPSPTNSSSRSFNMASPSAYQQPPSVPTGSCQGDLLTGSSYQIEPPGYQPAVTVQSYQQPSQPLPEVVQPPLASYHQQVMTPPVERGNRSCPSAPVVGYPTTPLHQGHNQSQPYPVGMPCAMNISPSVGAGAWPHFYPHQQHDVASLEFFQQQSPPFQHAQQSQPTPAAKIPSSCRQTTDKQLHRRCGKSCNKSVTPAMRSQAPSAPNVTIQRGTNVITNYGMYNANVGSYPSTIHNGSLHPSIGYGSGSHAPTLSYPGTYIVDPRQQVMPPTPNPQMDFYQRQQRTNFPAGQTPGAVHSGMYANSATYGFINGAMPGQQTTFGMNIMRP